MPPTSAPAASESAKEYAQRQRGHILEAARQCFIEHGFEAASMSRIAAHAGVSTGLPYHYFHNKREIVLSLVHHQLQESHGIIDQLPATLDLAGSLAEAFARWAGGDLRETLHAGLHAEITALGTRDRQVAGSLRTADRESRRDIAGWLKRIADECGNDLDDPELQLRALMFQLLIDGLAARAAREPDLDRAQIDGLLQRMLPLITG